MGGVCDNLIEESGRPQWPPFREELADLEADSSFSLNLVTTAAS